MLVDWLVIYARNVGVVRCVTTLAVDVGEFGAGVYRVDPVVKVRDGKGVVVDMKGVPEVGQGADLPIFYGIHISCMLGDGIVFIGPDERRAVRLELGARNFGKELDDADVGRPSVASEEVPEFFAVPCLG